VNASVRIWSLHPKYLDARGLVALWREALLAQAVLRGRTTGYVHHPQLIRFRAQSSPVGSIGEYLRTVHEEASTRGYRFAAARITRARAPGHLTVTRGQLQFEWHHLLEKLRARDPERLGQLATVKTPQPHPLFRVVRGTVALWEKGRSPAQPAAAANAPQTARHRTVDKEGPS
jgi:pyrimidine dimer DNA glycosylase